MHVQLKVFLVYGLFNLYLRKIFLIDYLVGHGNIVVPNFLEFSGLDEDPIK